MYRNETAAPIEYIEREGQVRKHYQTITTAVIIPLTQAGITGMMTAIMAAILAAVLDFYPWHVLGLVFVVTTTATWFYLELRWYKFVLALEGITGIDLNRDGKVERHTVRIELTSEDRKHAQFLDVDIEPSKLARMSQRVLSGSSFSEDAMSNILSRKEFNLLRDEFIKRQWLSWKNPDSRSQGLEFTKAGQAVIRSLSRELKD